MKKLKHQLYIVIVFSMGLMGCEDFFTSEVKNLDLPGTRPQLVVNSWISPQDTLIRVFLNRTQPYISNGGISTPVGDQAHVYMARENGAFVQLAYHARMGCFVIPARVFPIQPNTRYRLKVETFAGETATAECFVPEFDVDGVFIDPPYLVQDKQWGETTRTDWRIRTKAAPMPQYYRCGVVAKMYEVYTNYQGEKDTVFRSYQDLEVHRGAALFTDKQGAEYKLSARMMGRNATYTPDEKDPGFGYYPHTHDSLFVYVFATDLPYYRFHLSARNYFAYNDDSPFSETVHIYSNIKGGLGAFGGFNQRLYYVPVAGSAQ